MASDKAMRRFWILTLWLLIASVLVKAGPDPMTRLLGESMVWAVAVLLLVFLRAESEQDGHRKARHVRRVATPGHCRIVPMDYSLRARKTT